MSASNAEHILECQNISLSFGGLQVLSDVSLALAPGERRVILGPNGAGKTTFFNVICGELTPSNGHVLINGVNVTNMPSFTRIKFGLARTFQVTNLFFDLTVTDNILMAKYGCQSKRLWSWKSVTRDGDLREQAYKLLDDFSIGHLRNELVKNISYGDQRLLEIIMGISGNPQILALDEPSSGLSVAESQKLIDVINSLDKSLTILFIEHDMSVAFSVAQTVSVLHRGRIIADGPADEVKNSSTVRDVYMGVM